jgi:4-hydroxybenzoate polyprenyltransferase
VKSTAVLFGDHIRTVLSMFALGFIGCLVCAGLLNGAGVSFFVIAVGGTVRSVCSTDEVAVRDNIQRGLLTWLETRG